MELSKKYKALLLRSKLHSIMLHKTVKLCKQSTDLELVIIHDNVRSELIKRGILDND